MLTLIFKRMPDRDAQTPTQPGQESNLVLVRSREPQRHMDRDVYIVSAAGNEWSITLNGQVAGTFSRRSDALLAAIICADASARIGHDAEVLTRSASGETHSVWTHAYDR
jgi:hypothetical protein